MRGVEGMKNCILRSYVICLLLFIGLVNPQFVKAQNMDVYPQTGVVGLIFSLAFSPDGKWILSDSNGTAQIWDANTGREFRTNPGIKAMGWSPNGKSCLGISENTVMLWDPMSGNVIKSFRHDNVISAAFSPNGHRIVSGSKGDRPGDNMIKTWDIENEKELLSIRTTRFKFLGNVAYSPDGRRILAGSRMDENSIRIWDAETGQEVKAILGDLWDSGQEVLFALSGTDGTTVVYNPDGKTIIWTEYFDKDASIKILDAETGRTIRNIKGGKDMIGTLGCSPDGRKIVSAANFSTDNDVIKVWDVNTGRELKRLSGISMVYSITYTSDGRRMAYNNGGYIKILDAETYRELLNIKPIDKHTVYGVNSNGKKIITTTSSAIHLWSIETGQRLWSIPDNGHSHIVFSPNRMFFAKTDNTTNRDRGANNISIYETETGKLIRTWSNLRQIETDEIAWTSDGKRIATFTNTFLYKNIARIDWWNVNDGKLIGTEIEHDPNPLREGIPIEIADYAFNTDASRIVYLFGDFFQIWDTRNKRQLSTVNLNGTFDSIRWSLDGKRIVVYGGQLVTTWNAETGAKIWEKRLDDGVHGILYSIDGSKIMPVSGSNITNIFDAATGKTTGYFTDPIGTNSGIITLDGKWLVTGSVDGTVRVRSAETFIEKARFIAFNDGEWLAMTPDGYYTGSAKGDQYLNVRVGNTVTGIDRYRSTFNKPAVVAARLQ
jgi:WD40 repeat protein